MAKYLRPTNDFWVTDLKSTLEIVARHTQAGFSPLPESTVRLHEFLLFEFLYQKGLIAQRLAENPQELQPNIALRNRHLTDKGYYFLQKYLPRWQERLYKHTNEAKEWGYLEKWYQQFCDQQPNRAVNPDATR